MKKVYFPKLYIVLIRCESKHPNLFYDSHLTRSIQQFIRDIKNFFLHRKFDLLTVPMVKAPVHCVENKTEGSVFLVEFDVVCPVLTD